MDRVAGLLLTGGASSRMGVAKTEIRRGGHRLADRAATVLAQVCDPVLEVGPGASALDHVVEPDAGSGPLVALVAGAAALRERGHDGALLLLAVDLPFVEPPLLARIARHPPVGSTVVPVSAGVPQPLCARYSVGACREAARIAASGRRSLRALLDAVPWDALDEEAWLTVAPANALDDVDTPADVERFDLEWPG